MLCFLLQQKKRRGESRGKKARNGKIKLSLFADNMNVYEENAKESTKKIHHLVNELARCKLPFSFCLSFFMLYLVLHFSLLCFLLMISLFKMALQHRAKVLSSVPKCNKAVMSHGKKMCQIKLQSGVSYSAIGHKFNVNESTCIE